MRTQDSRGRSRLPALGRRGEGWVAGQALLIVAVLLSAFAGRGWSGDYAVVAYALGGTLLLLGVLLLAAGAGRLGGSLTPFPAPRSSPALSTTGPYALVRHPMYGGGILIAFGWTIVFASIVGLVLSLALALFLDLKSRREEQWLADRLADYPAYRRRTPHRFLPFVY